MNCPTTVERLPTGLFRHTCPLCGFDDTTIPTEAYNRLCDVGGGGPGTEFRALTNELGLTPKSGCNCSAVARWMDRLGIDGCREHRVEILERLRENYDLYGLGDKLKAAAKAVTSGLAWRIDLRDPLGWMLDEAVRRAAQASP